MRPSKRTVALELYDVTTDPVRQERLLTALAHDENTGVRNTALWSLANIEAPVTEAVALELWAQDPSDDDRALHRISALWALYRIGSDQLERLLAEAERSQLRSLADYAGRIRRGEVRTDFFN